MSVFDDLGLDRVAIEAGIARFMKLKEARKELESIQIKLKSAEQKLRAALKGLYPDLSTR